MSKDQYINLTNMPKFCFIVFKIKTLANLAKSHEVIKFLVTNIFNSFHFSFVKF